MADTPSVPRGGTGKFMRQGQTAGPYGNEPNADTMASQAAKPARELKAK